MKLQIMEVLSTIKCFLQCKVWHSFICFIRASKTSINSEFVLAKQGLKKLSLILKIKTKSNVFNGLAFGRVGPQFNSLLGWDRFTK